MIKKLLLGIALRYDEFQAERNMIKGLIATSIMEELTPPHQPVLTHLDLHNQRKAELVTTMDEKAMNLS